MKELIKLIDDASNEYVLSDKGRTFDKGHEFIGNLQRSITGAANISAVTAKDNFSLAWEFLPYNDDADGSIGLKSLKELVYGLAPLAMTLTEYDVTESATVWLDPDSFQYRPAAAWGREFWEVQLAMKEI